MSKNNFGLPGIILVSSSDGGSVIGGGSGQDGLGDSKGISSPKSFKDWSNSKFFAAYDLNEDNQSSMDEYGLWWADNGFTLEQWLEADPANTPETWEKFVVPYL